MGPSFVKMHRLLNEILRLGHLDHGVQEATLAVFALELTLVSGNRNGRVSAALVSITDHAGQIEGDLYPVFCPGCLKRFLKKALILGSHWVCSRNHPSSGLTGRVPDKYPEFVRPS